MKTKRKVIAIAIIMELICCGRILYLWEYGWTVYGLGTLLQIFYMLIAMFFIVATVSVIIDRCQNKWKSKEIDEHAYKVAKINRKLQKYNPEWVKEGNSYTRRKDPDWREDRNMIKTYLIRFRNINPAKTTLEICEWCYWLGYHRARLQQKQAEEQQKQAEEQLIYEQAEIIESEQVSTQVYETHLSEPAQTEPDVFHVTGNLETDICTLLKMGVQGKEIAEVLSTSPAKVSRVKKKMEG